MNATTTNNNELRISFLQFLLNNISHAILFESFENEIIFINQNFCALFEIPLAPEMLTGSNCSAAAKQSAHLFKDPDQFIESIAATYRNKVAVLNTEFFLADGTSIYRDYKPISEHANFSGHLWVYKNSLEIKQAIKEVQDQKNFYENLLNNLPADIAIFDKEHRYLFINKLAVSKNDTRNWLLGKDDFDFCREYNRPIELATKRRKMFEFAIASKQTAEFEEINITKEGNRVFNLRRFFPVENPAGDIDTVIGYGINISKLREREELLATQEQAYRELVESVDQMVVVISGSGLIRFTNSKWTSITGFAGDACLGTKLVSYIKTNKQGFNANVNSFVADTGYKTFKRTVSINNKLGKRSTFTYYIAAFTNSQLTERRFAVFFNDITLQLRAEVALKKIARQERKLNDLKSHFIGLVSHEMRTPLSVILSNTELIEMKNARSFSSIPPVSVNINRIIEQVSKMTRLMNDFLFFGRIEMDKVPLQITHFDVKKLLNKICEELFLPWTDGRLLDCSLKGNSAEVSGDELMIRNSIVNIINNAFKYSINLGTPKLRLRFTKNGWSVMVIDSGIGISEADQKRIFHPFVRGSNVDEIEGTGLGLVVVKYFLKKNKGRMLLKSSVNRGTAVLLKFSR